MMNNKNVHITHLLEDSLRDAIKQVRIGQGNLKQDNDFHFKRIVFNQEHNLVVFEIGGKQSHNLPELPFAVSALQVSMLSNPNVSRVDLMEVGKNTYLYFWVTVKEQFEVENLAYAT